MKKVRNVKVAGIDKTILIGMPNYTGMVPVEMVQSLLQLHKPYQCAFIPIKRQRTDKACNIIAMEALRGNVDYLMIIGDDNPFPPDTLELFIKDDKDIVLAPILSRLPDKSGKHTLCAFYSKEVVVDGVPLRIYYNIDKFNDPSPLHRISIGGTGCMLIKRDVLRALYNKYGEDIFEYGDIRFKQKVLIDGIEYDRRTMSEDCEFCERASDLGFEIWLDERIRPIHLTEPEYVQWTG